MCERQECMYAQPVKWSAKAHIHVHVRLHCTYSCVRNTWCYNCAWLQPKVSFVTEAFSNSIVSPITSSESAFATPLSSVTIPSSKSTPTLLYRKLLLVTTPTSSMINCIGRMARLIIDICAVSYSCWTKSDIKIQYNLAGRLGRADMELYPGGSSLIFLMVKRR